MCPNEKPGTPGAYIGYWRVPDSDADELFLKKPLYGSLLGKAAAFKINDWLIAPTASPVGFNVAAEEVVVRGDLIALVETADS